MYNRYAKDVKFLTDLREEAYTQEPARSLVLERWRKLGFTNTLPEEWKELEFVIAQSLETMASYLLSLQNDDNYPGDWEEAFFSFIKRTLNRMHAKHPKACRLIEPEEIISFLREKDIYDLLRFMASRDCENRSIYRRQTYETLVYTIRRYCEANGFKFSLFNAYMQLKNTDDGVKFGEIFLPGDQRDAVYLSYVADYFMHELYEFDKMYNNRRKRNGNTRTGK